MANRHEANPNTPRIYTEFSYRPASDPQPVVIETTASLMNMYFNGIPMVDRTHLSYFANETIDYIDLARQGFRRNIHKIDRLGIVSREDLERFMGMSFEVPELDDEATEAFGRALVTFSFMPEYATNEFLPKGFSRRGVLAPPATTREFWNRLGEMTSEMMALGYERTDPDVLKFLNDPSLVRTYWFFQTARQLPLHMDDLGRKKRNLAIERFEDMLGD